MLLKQRKGQWNEKYQTEKLPVKIKNQPPLEGGVPPLYILVRRIRRIVCFGKTCARRKKNSKYFRKNRVDLWAIDQSAKVYRQKKPLSNKNHAKLVNTTVFKYLTSQSYNSSSFAVVQPKEILPSIN